MQYEGRDLEAMSFAENYHRWIRDEFNPMLGKHIVEVGAGTGDFSALLAETHPEALVLIEPSESQCSLLKKRFESSDSTFPLNGFLGDVADRIQNGHSPDSIVYVN